MSRIRKANAIGMSSIISLAIVAGPASPAAGGITRASGAMKQAESPPDVRTGQYEDDHEIRIFREQQDLKLEQPIETDISKPGESPMLTPQAGPRGKSKRPRFDPNFSPKQIAAGRQVNSYYLHFDAVGDGSGGGADREISGRVTFDEKILGVVVTADHLLAANGPLGRDGTSYPDGDKQGTELTRRSGTRITLSKDRRTLEVKLKPDRFADNIRVITLAAKAPQGAPARKPVGKGDDDAAEDAAEQADKAEQPKAAQQAQLTASELMPKGSVWRGVRISSLGQLKRIGCIARVIQSNGNRVVLNVKEEGGVVREWYMQVRGNALVLQNVQVVSNNPHQFSSENTRGSGTFDAKGIRIEYHWYSWQRRVKNQPEFGTLELQRDD